MLDCHTLDCERINPVASAFEKMNTMNTYLIENPLKNYSILIVKYICKINIMLYNAKEILHIQII